MGADQSRAILKAYKQVMDASWPALHLDMAQRSLRWDHAAGDELDAELAGYLEETARSGSPVRIFWKLGSELIFGGANAAFARDAGVADPAELVGIDDFDTRLPWTRQASKYRDDDEQVFYSRRPRLDIIERQKHSDDTIIWVRVGKVPIVVDSGEVIGVLGMYEVLDSDVGRKLYAERLQDPARQGR